MCLAQALHEAPAAKQYVLDFSQLEHAPPFGMLLSAACIRQFRERVSVGDSTARFAARGVARNTYAAYMGFFHSARIGSQAGEAPGNSRCLPIRQAVVASVRARAIAQREPVSRTLDGIAHRLSEVLAQEPGGPLETTISYSLRELLRNVIEHSEAPVIWRCAQFWPSMDKVEICILDEGRGILASLRENYPALPDEEHAVRAAVEPGVTRVNPRTQEVPGMWPGYGGDRSENAGYGLYVIRELARHAGSLFILSNQDGVEFRKHGTVAYQCAFAGTAIRLVLKPSLLGDLLQRVLEHLPNGVAPSRLTPSMLARLSAPASLTRPASEYR